jgi:DNA polymerase-3 subunit alpha
VSQKGKRFAFYNDEFFFKTKDQMAILRGHARSAGQHRFDRGQDRALKLKKDILLPNYEIAGRFRATRTNT